jgi:hypothetical protein
VHRNTIRYNQPPFSFMYCCVLVLQGTLVDSFHVSVGLCLIGVILSSFTNKNQQRLSNT